MWSPDKQINIKQYNICVPTFIKYDNCALSESFVCGTISDGKYCQIYSVLFSCKLWNFHENKSAPWGDQQLLSDEVLFASITRLRQLKKLNVSYGFINWWLILWIIEFRWTPYPRSGFVVAAKKKKLHFYDYFFAHVKSLNSIRNVKLSLLIFFLLIQISPEKSCRQFSFWVNPDCRRSHFLHFSRKLKLLLSEN